MNDIGDLSMLRASIIAAENARVTDIQDALLSSEAKRNLFASIMRIEGGVMASAESTASPIQITLLAPPYPHILRTIRDGNE